jgi:hypothetical protein
VFEKKMLRKIFGPKRDEVTGGWIKLHNDDRRDMYSAPSIIRMIKSRRMKWAGYVARMGEKRNAYSLLMGKPEGKRLLEGSNVGWMILERQNGVMYEYTGLVKFRKGTSGELL